MRLLVTLFTAVCAAAACRYIMLGDNHFGPFWLALFVANYLIHFTKKP